MTAHLAYKARRLFPSVTCDRSIAELLGCSQSDIARLREQGRG